MSEVNEQAAPEQAPATEGAEAPKGKKTKAAKAPKEPKPEVVKAPKDAKNGVSRPATGVTLLVWTTADNLSRDRKNDAGEPDPGPIDRATLTKALEGKVQMGTVHTQYGRWRKYYGLVETKEARQARLTDVAAKKAAEKAAKKAESDKKKADKAAAKKAKEDAEAAAKAVEGEAQAPLQAAPAMGAAATE